MHHFQRRSIALMRLLLVATLFTATVAILRYVPPAVLAVEIPAATTPAPCLARFESPRGEMSFARRLRADPVAALEQARLNHLRDIRDYTCTFVKQERLAAGLTDEQVIDVKFRQEPYSVFMHWVRNPGRAHRVIYVKGRWIDPDADTEAEREQAVCQPGPIARLFVRSLYEPIRGDAARDASRRAIDQFGFGCGMELLTRYCRMADAAGGRAMTLVGESQFAGRPTWLLRRVLPYRRDAGPYPDRVAVIHLDRQWRIPVSIRCYSDDGQSQLLGRYEYRDVCLNPGLPDQVFEPATYGM